MVNSLIERLQVSIDRDWLVAQIDAISTLSFQEKITAGKCLGRFEHHAWCLEETAFLESKTLERVTEIATIALDHCDKQAPSDEMKAELTRIRTWLFTEE